jgi:hypothetical protein
VTGRWIFGRGEQTIFIFDHSSVKLARGEGGKQIGFGVVKFVEKNAGRAAADAGSRSRAAERMRLATSLQTRG